MFGTLDIVVLGGIAGVAVYWFYIRNKEEQVDIKDFKVTSGLQRTSSFDPSFVSKMKHGHKNVVVFYGSQTGTAEEFAGRLAKDAARYGMKAMIADPEECDMEELSSLKDIENSLAIFCLATYGEGDPTDNAQEFYDWLQDGSTELDGLRYAVFGLGNKTYEHYNAMGIYVDKRLEQLGAERVADLGLGDDDANIEEDFVNWREKFWPSVCEKLGISAVEQDISFRQYTVTVHDDLPREDLFIGEPVRLGSLRKQRPPFDAKNPFMSSVTVNRELHKGGDRSCMHIEFDITDSKIRYDAGDHVAVFPENDSELVDYLGHRLAIDLDTMITLTNVDEDASKVHPFPCPTTYRTALTHYLDITSPPRTNVLKELIEYATQDADKEFLKKISSPNQEGQELYNEWIIKDHRTIGGVLQDLPSVLPPIDHLCELLPKLHPRYYSISSSPKMYPTSIHITAVLTDWVTRIGRRQKGVATSWLKQKIPAGEMLPKVPIFVRKSQFRLPFKPSVPVIMIGPGTGLAPFRGFIQERHQMKQDGKPVGDSVLYFGCRHSKEDYIYQDELEQYLTDQTLTKVYLAFSRDQDKKVYVQNLLNENSQEVFKYLEDGAHIYVCGDARHMAPDVDRTLKEIVMEHGGKAESDALDYLKKLRTRGRYSCDVWS